MAMFVQVRNVSPLGGLRAVLDGVPVDVDAGGTVQVSPEQATSLLEQPENWEPVNPGGPATGQEQS